MNKEKISRQNKSMSKTRFFFLLFFIDDEKLSTVNVFLSIQNVPHKKENLIFARLCICFLFALASNRTNRLLSNNIFIMIFCYDEAEQNVIFYFYFC